MGASYSPWPKGQLDLFGEFVVHPPAPWTCSVSPFGNFEPFQQLDVSLEKYFFPS